MADSTVHFAAGIIVASALTLSPLVRAWREKQRLAGHFRRWIVLSFGLGCLAIAPGLLRHAGLPDALCSAWWMNVFVFYPLLNAVPIHGTIVGPAMIMICAATAYFLLLVAAARARRRRRESAAG